MPFPFAPFNTPKLDFSMSAINLLLLAAFAVALILGAAAQASRFCLHGGLRDALFKRDGRRLAAFFLAVAVAIALVGVVQVALGQFVEPSRPPLTSPNLAWGRYLVGGLVFGVGMILARGCPLRNLVRVAQGNVQALVVLIVMAASAYAMTRTSLYAEVFAPWLGTWTIDLRKWGFGHQDLGTLLGIASPAARLLLALAVAVPTIAVAWRYLPLQSARVMTLGAAVIGATIAAGYALTAGPLGAKAIDDAAFLTLPPDGMGVQSYTFSGPLADTVYFLLHPSAQTLSFGVAAVAGVLVGVLISALLRGEFRWEAGVVPRVLLRQCIGAVLAGIGAILALGCTIGNGLSGLAVLSAGATLGLAAIVAGAWLTLKAEALLAARSGTAGVAESAA